nr:uncharacterized protein LOC107435052 [Ziziphus jujuba var. spinosa]
MAGHIEIVTILVNNMSEEDLEITDGEGFTALAVAIRSNAKRSIAHCMVQKNMGLLFIETNNMLPVAMAFSYGHTEMGRYLYSLMPLSKDYLIKNQKQGARILCDAIHMQSFDVALALLSECRELAITDLGTSLQSPVYALASLSSAFASGCHLSILRRWLYQCILKDSTAAINHILTELQNQSIHTDEGSTTVSAGCKVWSKLQGVKFYVYEFLGMLYSIICLLFPFFFFFV